MELRPRRVKQATVVKPKEGITKARPRCQVRSRSLVRKMELRPRRVKQATVVKMSRGNESKANKKRRHTNGSDDADCTISLADVLTRQTKVSDTASEVCSGQNLKNHKRQKKNKEQLQKDENEDDLITSQAEDKAVLNIIESIHHGRVIELRKEDNPIPSYVLDRALISACHQGLKYHVQTLVGLGANVEVKDTHGNTPLLICAGSCFIDIVSFLLTWKANINAFNCAGDTALILSIRASGSSEMVKIILKQAGIDINHQNRDGYTALMKAIEVKDVSTIRILIDQYHQLNLVHKSDLLNQAVNCKGETAQQIAEKCEFKNLIKIIKRYREELPFAVVSEAYNLKTLNIVLNCQFLYPMEVQTSVDRALTKMLKYCKSKKDYSVIDDEIAMIRMLLEHGACVGTNGETYGRDSNMIVAVEVGNYSLVALLCLYTQRQQRWHHYFIGIQTLNEAVKTGRCDLVKLLLYYGADIYQIFYSGSPLYYALNLGHFECAQLLIKHGARMDINNALVLAGRQLEAKYMTFLFDNYRSDILYCIMGNLKKFSFLLPPAARWGNLEIIEHLLDAGADINFENYSQTPLAMSKNGEVAKFLLSRGAKINQIICFGGSQPLLNVVLRRGNCAIDVVNVLLDNGCSVNVRCSDCKTPLMVAASNKENAATLKVLLDHGAGFNDQDKDGNTALIMAVDEDCEQNVSFLLQYVQEKNHCLDAQNNIGYSALICAVVHSNLKIVQMLVDCGADVNIKDNHGNSALGRAVNDDATESSKEIMTTLIRAGSDVNYQDYDVCSPLMLAAKYLSKCYLSILLNSGADVNAVNKNDNTKTALSFLGDISSDAILCLKALLERGAISSYVKPCYLHKVILSGHLDLIPKLIQNGVGPTNIRSSFWMDNDYVDNISPLCVALLVGNVSLARYFMGNMFLTNSDVSSLASDKTFRHYLENKKYNPEKSKRKECLNFLDEFYSQPMSLFQLAFVTVSSAVGASHGRENRVNMLPLPQVIKDKLLFKSEGVTFSIPAGDSNTHTHNHHFHGQFRFICGLYSYCTERRIVHHYSDDEDFILSDTD